MTPEFLLITTSRFDRELRKLAARHPGLPESDPYNRSRQHAIKKLEAVPAGEGQYRIRSGRFRFRHDMDGRTVQLKACSLRREDTY